ncbi:MAG: septum formation protein Maf [Candidatus Heimdallarchaeota archaeon]|nr:septum formation protein Maf [Candidatus Heimdallarchaeota archaeon]
MKKIILASGSPRRHELMALIGIPHEVIPCNVVEKELSNSKTIEEVLLEVAYQKILCVESSLPDDKSVNSLIIGADTTVILQGEIIGKPKDKEEAISMLKKILGTVHEVYTGVCILDTTTRRLVTGVEKTLVSMVALTDEKIAAYVDNEYVIDKAGAYAIQGIGAALIDRIDGCFYNVMGLPLSRLVLMLESQGYEFLTS